MSMVGLAAAKVKKRGKRGQEPATSTAKTDKTSTSGRMNPLDGEDDDLMGRQTFVTVHRSGSPESPVRTTFNHKITVDVVLDLNGIQICEHDGNE